MSFNWKEHFPMVTQKMNGQRLAYLDSAATALKPLSVVKAMDAYLTEHTSNVHRGIYRLSEENTSAFEKVRDQVKAFVNARAREEVIFTRGTTESLNLVAQSWGRANLKAGDEILLTGLEHHANIVPWWQLAQEKGAVLKEVPLNDDGTLNEDAFLKLLSPRTKVFALSMASNTMGVKTNAAKLSKLAKEAGAIVVLDGAQAAPHFPIDVQALGCDFLAFSGHKAYGPNGVGVLWGRQELLEAMPPWQGGGNMISTVTFDKITWNKLPEKFEPGTPVIAEVLGFGAALDFMALVGWKEIQERDHALLTSACRALREIPGVRVYGDCADKIATFAFNVDGIHPQDLGQVLDQQGVAVRTGHHCTQPLMARFGCTAMVRASFGPYNDDQDVAQLADGIRKAQRLFL